MSAASAFGITLRSTKPDKKTGRSGTSPVSTATTARQSGSGAATAATASSTSSPQKAPPPVAPKGKKIPPPVAAKAGKLAPPTAVKKPQPLSPAADEAAHTSATPKSTNSKGVPVAAEASDSNDTTTNNEGPGPTPQEIMAALAARAQNNALSYDERSAVRKQLRAAKKRVAGGLAPFEEGVSTEWLFRPTPVEVAEGEVHDNAPVEEPEVRPHTDIAPQTALGEAKEKAEAHAEAQAQAEEKARLLAEATAKSQADVDAKTKLLAEAEAKVQAEATAKSQAEAEVKAKAEAEATAKAKLLAEAEAQAKIRAKQAAVDAEARAVAEEMAKAEADIRSQNEAQAAQDEAQVVADAKTDEEDARAAARAVLLEFEAEDILAEVVARARSSSPREDDGGHAAVTHEPTPTDLAALTARTKDNTLSYDERSSARRDLREAKKRSRELGAHGDSFAGSLGSEPSSRTTTPTRSTTPSDRGTSRSPVTPAAQLPSPNSPLSEKPPLSIASSPPLAEIGSMSPRPSLVAESDGESDFEIEQRSSMVVAGLAGGEVDVSGTAYLSSAPEGASIGGDVGVEVDITEEELRRELAAEEERTKHFEATVLVRESETDMAIQRAFSDAEDELLAIRQTTQESLEQVEARRLSKSPPKMAGPDIKEETPDADVEAVVQEHCGHATTSERVSRTSLESHSSRRSSTTSSSGGRSGEITKVHSSQRSVGGARTYGEDSPSMRSPLRSPSTRLSLGSLASRRSPNRRDWASPGSRDSTPRSAGADRRGQRSTSTRGSPHVGYSPAHFSARGSPRAYPGSSPNPRPNVGELLRRPEYGSPERGWRGEQVSREGGRAAMRQLLVDRLEQARRGREDAELRYAAEYREVQTESDAQVQAAISAYHVSADR